MEPVENLIIVSDFNSDLLARLINNNDSPTIRCRTNGARKVIPSLIDDKDPIWKDQQIAFIWAQPHEISTTFARALEMSQVNHDQAIQEVEAFCKMVLRARSRARAVFVASLQMPWASRGYGVLDLQDGLGLRSLLERMNLHLQKRLSEEAGIHVLDTTSWLQVSEPYSEKMWFLTKMPFSPEVFRIAHRELKAAIQTFVGTSRKVVVCDLDNTLWGGVVGDDGWQNLRLGGHDGLGEAFVMFQRELKALSRRGVILAIVSKNTEDLAIEAIENHPEMILKKDDFAAWRINWGDKASNVVDLLRELNLGLESAVFLDDNPVERSRVETALPSVLVPEMPLDGMLFPAFLRGLDCFDNLVVSDEDRGRADSYRAQRERRESIPDLEDFESLDEWLPTLGMRVSASPINESNIKRATQLLNKTNQMNLRTRRMTEDEFSKWGQVGNRKVWTFRVTDRFADSGLTGLASIEVQGAEAFISDFVLSCRVMGKRVEETMIYLLTEIARDLGATRMIAKYAETDKNVPCRQFFQRSGLKDEDSKTFVWDLSEQYPEPLAVNLEVLDA